MQEGGKKVSLGMCREGPSAGPVCNVQHGGCVDLEERVPFSNARGGSGRFRRASGDLAGGGEEAEMILSRRNRA